MSPSRSRRLHVLRLGCTALLVLAVILSEGALRISRAGTLEGNNLLVNGDLSIKDGNLPRAWKTYALPGCGSRIALGSDQAEVPEIQISNSEPNEVSFTQPVKLEAGWYRLSAEVRTDDVSKHSGAYLYIAPQRGSLALTTSPIRGTRNWRRVELLFQNTLEKRSIIAGCRLGLPDSPATGSAFFRGLSLVRVDEPSNRGAFQYIDKLWQIDANAKPFLPRISSGAPRSIFGIVGVASFFGVLVLLALGGWRLLADALRP